MTKLTFKRNPTGGYKVYMHFAPLSVDPVPIGVTHRDKSDNRWHIEGLQSSYRTRDAAAQQMISLHLAPFIEAEQAKCAKRGSLGRRKRKLSLWVARNIYRILVDVLRAPADEVSRRSFEADQTSDNPASEWRFQGCLGFGGKFYNENDGFRVSCYVEDETPENLWRMARAQRMLDGFFIQLVKDPHWMDILTE